MSGENLDPLLQKPLSKACIRSCRSEKTVLNFFINLFKIGSDTPLYYIQIINFTIYLIINPLTPLSLTAMPFRGFRGFLKEGAFNTAFTDNELFTDFNP
jgi:hypothetical protein